MCSSVLLTIGFAALPVLAQEGAAGGEAAGGPAIEQTSFAKAFFISQGSILGTAIIWFLLALSAVSFGLMGFLWINNRRVNILPQGMVDQSNRLLNERKYRELLQLVSQEESYFSQVLASSLREASHGFGAMVRALEQAGEEFTTRRLRQIELLSVIGNVAPMIGLFGTVYGMILTFQGIVASGGRPDPIDLAGGIGTALTTTFWGLIVAIPSLAGFAIIRNNIDTLTSEASLVAGEIVNQFRPSPNAPVSAGAGSAQSTSTATATAVPTRPSPSGAGASNPSTSPISSRSPLSSAVASTRRARDPHQHPVHRQSSGRGAASGPDAPDSPSDPS